MKIGVVGAGTMGAGIARAAASGGCAVLLHDVDGDAARRVASAWQDAGAGGSLGVADELHALGGCELVVEAIVEELGAKRGLLAALADAAPDAVLATNTSSLPVTALARGLPDPGRLVGLHFFNPVERMELVEIVAGLASSPAALAVARSAGAALGKTVVEVADGPGFLVNRCNRPFGLEALRLLESGVAEVETIDDVVRAAGFPMGPFALADLIGLDVGLAVAESFFAQSYGESRWRPSPLVAQRVAAGLLGRKSGRGWHVHPHRPEASPAPPLGGGDGRVVLIAGGFNVADELRYVAEAGGFQVLDEPDDDVPWLILDCGHEPDERGPLQGAPQALLVAEASLHQLDPGGPAVGFHALGPLDAGSVLELTRGPGTAASAVRRIEEFAEACGLQTIWVQDAAGLILGRIVAQLVNEACFALDAGVTDDPAALDTAMVLALRHPRGPLAWADEIGLDHVLTILDALRAELGEERYRASPRLRQMVAEGRHGVSTGEGFHGYPVEPHVSPPHDD